MEQILTHQVAEMSAMREEMDSNREELKTNQETMEAKMGLSRTVGQRTIGD
jgi:hypothetical protein